MKPLCGFIRATGQAGLFTLSVLRASKPTRDFLAELVREIYKIGGRSLPIIAVGGAFVGLSVILLGYRALDTYGASNQVSAMLGLGLYRELAPVLTVIIAPLVVF
jgi:phospholipid/cholesterol/gamma-HCH transport system permease protein